MLIDFRDLFKKYNLSFNGVLHVGSNIGEEAPVYRELGIHKQIWIEPNKELLPRLNENVQAHGVEAYVMNVCAGDENKTVMLHIANNGGQSSSVLELGTHATVHPEVHYVRDQEILMVRLEDFLVDEVIANVDLLVMDIQGAELMALRGLGKVVDQFKAIYLEVNSGPVYKGGAELPDIDLFMTAHRFRRVELYNNGGHFDRLHWSDALYIKD